MDKPIRLQKYLAEQGLCSRRLGEAWIEAGRITKKEKMSVWIS